MSAITDHVCQTNHLIDWDTPRMVERDSDWIDRGMKEELVIRKHPQNFNRDAGLDYLSHLYDLLLDLQARDMGVHQLPSALRSPLEDDVMSLHSNC